MSTGHNPTLLSIHVYLWLYFLLYLYNVQELMVLSVYVVELAFVFEVATSIWKDMWFIYMRDCIWIFACICLYFWFCVYLFSCICICILDQTDQHMVDWPHQCSAFHPAAQSIYQTCLLDNSRYISYCENVYCGPRDISLSRVYIRHVCWITASLSAIVKMFIAAHRIYHCPEYISDMSAR